MTINVNVKIINDKDCQNDCQNSNSNVTEAFALVSTSSKARPLIRTAMKFRK